MSRIYFYNIISYIFIGILLLLAFWWVYPYKLMEFKNAPFPIINTIVNSGGRMVYEVDYCKYTNQSPRVTKYFIDGVVYEVNTVDGIFEKGCHKVKRDIYIPRALPVGSYSVKIVAIFTPNPIREVQYTTNTLNFTIVK